MRSLIDAFNGPFGKIVAGLDRRRPEWNWPFFRSSLIDGRSSTECYGLQDLVRGKDAGDLETDTEPELLNDAIFGAISATACYCAPVH